MQVKLDENLGTSVVAVFEAAGHDVATVYGQGMAGTKDEGIYAACCREGRVLVTLDLDFANPFRHDPRSTPGIAVLRVPDQPGLQDLLRVASILLVRLGEARRRPPLDCQPSECPPVRARRRVGREFR